MSRAMVHTTTLEEKFMFGSPPLLNGFASTTCRLQEGISIRSNVEQHRSSENQCAQSFYANDDQKIVDEVSDQCVSNLENLDRMNNGYRSNNSYGSSFPTHPKHTYRIGNSLADNFHNLKFNASRTSHVDNGIKSLEQAGMSISSGLINNETVFKKRKDLRVLKSVLSNERFREVVMKFGDGDEGGREIIDSVHKTMRSSNVTSVSCLFCSSHSMVYENFPVVDGTLFLTPVRLSGSCINFSEPSDKNTRYMGYICVKCMEGKSKTLCCSSCAGSWNGSFFQIGTLYSYNILFATPCCSHRVSCKNCHQTIINLENGDASNLFFSHFSKRVICPHCENEDYHYIKELSTISKI